MPGNEEEYVGSIIKLVNALWRGLSVSAALFYYNWGLIFARWGQPHRAFWYMNRAVMMNTTNPKGYYHRASLFMAVGNLRSAVQDFTTAINLDPQYTDAYFNRGLAYRKLGQQEQADRDFAKAKELGVE